MPIHGKRRDKGVLSTYLCLTLRQTLRPRGTPWAEEFDVGSTRAPSNPRRVYPTANIGCQSAGQSAEHICPPNYLITCSLNCLIAKLFNYLGTKLLNQAYLITYFTCLITYILNYLSVCLYPSLYLRVCIPVCLPLSVSMSVSVSLFQLLSVCLCLYLSLHSVCLCPSIFCLSLSLSLDLNITHGSQFRLIFTIKTKDIA